MGTPDFAVGVLKGLVEDSRNVVGVITSVDKPAGRGRSLRESAVKKYAVEQGIPILQPKNLKDENFLKDLAGWEADLQVIVAFRMLPKVVWDMPPKGTFNLHASLLPQYRGAAPINWAIINGEKKSGVTTFFIDEKIDTGAIIASREVNISEEDTAGTLHDSLMEVGKDLVLETLDLIEGDAANPKVQPKDVELKEAPKLNPDNTRIEWTKDPADLVNFVRGLCPYPVAWTLLSQESAERKVKVYKVHFDEDEHNLQTGRIEADKNHIKVAVKTGWIYIDELQLPGKRKMVAKDLLNGFQFEKEARFL